MKSSKIDVSPLEDYPHLSEQFSCFLKSQYLYSSSESIEEVLKCQLEGGGKDRNGKLILSESESLSLRSADFEMSLLDYCDNLSSATSPAKIVEILHHMFTVIYTRSGVGMTQKKESQLLIGNRLMQVLDR